MIGIYKYQNKINNKVYIGQSINIEQRKNQHKSSIYNEKAKDYNSQFHQAVRKYGDLDNFSFEILIELDPLEYTYEILNDLERYYIKQFDSFHGGYNATEGGDSGYYKIHPGESNGRAKLTEDDVKYIRECYNAHIPFRTIYQEYKDKITKRGLQKIWWFDTWKNIYPEYHTEENKYWHSHQAKANLSEVAANNKRVFTEQQIKQMRKDYDNGMSPKEIWKKYAPDRAWSTVYNAVIRQTYKEIE